MPLSVGGGQLPLSAFFGSSGSSAKRPTKPRVASKRKDSPVRARAGEPPNKKRKQKENVTPSIKQLLENAPQQSSSKTRGRRSSTSEMEIDEDMSVELTEAARASIGAGDAMNDLTPNASQDVIPNSPSKRPHNLETPPLTPEVQDRRRDFDSTTSLPSPPLTAPDVKRARKNHDDGIDRQENALELRQVALPDRDIRLGSVDIKDVNRTSPSDTPAQGHAMEHVALCSPKAPRRSMDLMPPPPLPLKALLSPSSTLSATAPMPLPVQFHRPRSVSSEKWVPSSQTQELSIPRYEDIQDDQSSDEAPQARRGRASQVVPSSQLSERELEILHSSSYRREARKSSSSSVLVDGSSDSASSSAALSATSAAAVNHSEESVIHEIVESSQSQFETEITAAWAETLATRREALRWPRMSSSSPSRAVESQDYDAQSEWSSSIDEVSQSLTMDPRTSPLLPPSQLPSAESSGSYGDSDLTSYSVLPSQLRRFLDTFEGRDDDGNELPRDTGVGSAQSPAQSPSSSTQDRSQPPCRRVFMPSPSRSQSAYDNITASPPVIPQEYVSDGGSSYGSSVPSTMPTPLRNFLEMFPDTQTQDQPGVEPSQRWDDDGYDF